MAMNDQISIEKNTKFPTSNFSETNQEARYEKKATTCIRIAEKKKEKKKTTHLGFGDEHARASSDIAEPALP